MGLQVREGPALSQEELELLKMAGLHDLVPVEAWMVTGSNRQLAYSTHGVFRFFGKFPAPIARHLILSYSKQGDWVLDPMAGSGTTAVEALDLSRNVVARDVSPLSTLLCRVKTTHVSEEEASQTLARVRHRFERMGTSDLPKPVGLLNPDHWFRDDTMESLGRLRAAIEPEADAPSRDLLLVAFVATVRRVSRATTQQGRLFLDVATALPDAWPTFEDRYHKFAAAVAGLPEGPNDVTLVVEQVDATISRKSGRRFQLAITHPPYFNNYKYSSINSLELAWLGVPPKTIRKQEIREAFKIGKPEKVGDYVEDLAKAVRAIGDQLDTGGTLALMMGDTTIRGGYIRVTHLLLEAIERLTPDLHLDKVALRIPQYTEASWVASQRRTGEKVGVTLNDFILLFSKKRQE